MYKFDENIINFESLKQPYYKNEKLLASVLKDLQNKEGIANVNRIKKLLSELARPDNLILQIGDCAEPIIESHSDLYYYANSTEKFIGKLSGICSINYANIIKIARIAGQFAKPRSIDTETKNGTTLPAYMGDLINQIKFTEQARDPDPKRMLLGYEHAKYIYNLKLDFYTSHEALLLPYERSLIRNDNGVKYLASADTVWVGNKTRFVGSNHIELLRDIINPVGIKIGHDYIKKEIDWIYHRLNPLNLKEKLMFVVRFGLKHVRKELKALLEYMYRNNMNFNILCDPMHGNTFIDTDGLKRRRLDDILEEFYIFQQVIKEFDIRSWGVHLEASFEQKLAECFDNMPDTDENTTANIEDQFYKTRASIFNNFYEKRDASSEIQYKSLCDPRLNNRQTLKVISTIK